MKIRFLSTAAMVMSLCSPVFAAEDGIGMQSSGQYANSFEIGIPESVSKEEYYQLGNRYQNGNGVEKDIEKAGKLYRKASDLGSEEAYELIKKNDEACMQDMRISASWKQGDYTEHLEPCFLVASWGDARTQFLLGTLYSQGNILQENSNKSKKWFYLAAQKGHVMAQHEMMQIYLRDAAKGNSASAAVAYGWLCTLEKQIRVTESPGMNMWQDPKMGFEAKLEQTRMAMEDIVANSSNPKLFKYEFDKICRDFPESMRNLGK